MLARIREAAIVAALVAWWVVVPALRYWLATWRDPRG